MMTQRAGRLHRRDQDDRQRKEDDQRGAQQQLQSHPSVGVLEDGARRAPACVHLALSYAVAALARKGSI